MECKICSKCGVEKPINDFGNDKQVKSGIKASCKECERKRHHEYARTHKEERKKTDEKHREKRREYSRKYTKEHPDRRKLQTRVTRQKIRNEWYLYFKSVGKDRCSLCGYKRCWAVIEFHHVNPLEKETEIAIRMIHKITDVDKKEVAKCIALCANCHRELHYLENCKNGSHIKSETEYDSGMI